MGALVGVVVHAAPLTTASARKSTKDMLHDAEAAGELRNTFIRVTLAQPARSTDIEVGVLNLAHGVPVLFAVLEQDRPVGQFEAHAAYADLTPPPWTDKVPISVTTFVQTVPDADLIARFLSTRTAPVDPGRSQSS